MLSDFRIWEVGAAVLVAGGVQFGAWQALKAVNLAQANAPDIEKTSEVPVKVTPVIDLDSPLLKYGSKKKAVLPDMWKRKKPKVRVEQKTYASTKAEKTEEAIPEEDVPMAKAGDKDPPPDAEVTKEVDTEIEEESDAGEIASTEEGHEDGSEAGTEMDPLKAHAVDMYRGRLAGFFQSGFRVTGTGLPDEELTKISVGASVQLSGLTVSGFSIIPSGNAAFDAAATAALQSKVGQQVPPPPDNYPDILEASISLSLRCGKGQCN